MILKTYKDFLDKFFSEFKKTGIALSGFDLDHLGYQASSSQDYEKIKEELLFYSKLGDEPILNGRRIGIFILKKELSYKDYRVKIVELIEPEETETKKSGWDHVEFTGTEEIELLLDKYPDLNWDISALKRERFQMLKLKLENGLRVKFPRMGLKMQLKEKGVCLRINFTK